MRLVLLFVAMLATHVDVASAQPEETVDALSAKAEALYKAGKHADAAVIAERAVAVAEHQFGPDHLAMAPPLEDLAQLRYRLGRYAEAEPVYRRSLAIRERALGAEHLDVAATLNSWPCFCTFRGAMTRSSPSSNARS